jgi:queuosine biosynthesis protein QueC
MEKRNGAHHKPGVILLGGGLDSGALLYWMRSHLRGKPAVKLHALWIEYGQKAAWGELNSVLLMCDRTGTPLHRAELDIHNLSSSALLRGSEANKKNLSRLNKLEARNVIFAGLAAMLSASLGFRAVYLGYHREPKAAPFPDATPIVRQAMSNLLTLACRPRIEVVAPFQSMTRLQILRLGLKLNPNLADETFTCYEGELDRECGQCAHCQRKQRMLKRAKAQSGPVCAPPESYGK